MAEQPSTPQHFFEESISLLFWLGQCPVIVVSYVTLVCIDLTYDTADSWSQAGVYLPGLAAPLLSLAAVTKWRTSQRIATCFLACSLIATLFYLTFLVRITQGSISPFHHLYLYLPAVVFMVTHRRHWAEIMTSIGVFMSYVINYSNSEKWGAWEQFHSCSLFSWYEILFVAFLLVLLICVNYRMEKLDWYQEIRQEPNG